MRVTRSQRDRRHGGRRPRAGQVRVRRKVDLGRFAEGPVVDAARFLAQGEHHATRKVKLAVDHAHGLVAEAVSAQGQADDVAGRDGVGFQVERRSHGQRLAGAFQLNLRQPLRHPRIVRRGQVDLGDHPLAAVLRLVGAVAHQRVVGDLPGVLLRQVHALHGVEQLRPRNPRLNGDALAIREERLVERHRRRRVRPGVDAPLALRVDAETGHRVEDDLQVLVARGLGRQVDVAGVAAVPDDVARAAGVRAAVGRVQPQFGCGELARDLIRDRIRADEELPLYPVLPVGAAARDDVAAVVHRDGPGVV